MDFLNKWNNIKYEVVTNKARSLDNIRSSSRSTKRPAKFDDYDLPKTKKPRIEKGTISIPLMVAGGPAQLIQTKTPNEENNIVHRPQPMCYNKETGTGCTGSNTTIMTGEKEKDDNNNNNNTSSNDYYFQQVKRAITSTTLENMTLLLSLMEIDMDITHKIHKDIYARLKVETSKLNKFSEKCFTETFRRKHDFNDFKSLLKPKLDILIYYGYGKIEEYMVGHLKEVSADLIDSIITTFRDNLLYILAEVKMTKDNTDGGHVHFQNCLDKILRYFVTIGKCKSHMISNSDYDETTHSHVVAQAKTLTRSYARTK